MKSPTNPLSVLSVEPADLRGLTDEQGIALARGFYHALMRIHHQDTGGTDVDKTVSLSAAMEVLEDPARFRFWRNILRSKSGRKNKLVEAEARTAGVADELAQSEARFIKLLETAVWPHPERVSIFGMKPARFLLTDTISVAIQIRDKMREPKFERFSNYYELTVGGDGTVRRFQIKQVAFDRQKENPPAGLPEGWVRLSNSYGASSYYVERMNDGKVMPGARIFGTVDRDRISFKDGDLRRFVALLPPRGVQVRPEDGFAFDLFRQYLSHFEPYIEKGRVLVGARKTDDGLRFLILGNIIAVCWM